MKIFLLKDVMRVGMASEMIEVSDGYALNYLIPQKLGVQVTEHNEKALQHKVRTLQKRTEVVVSKTSMLAEQIKGLKAVLRVKTHDGDRLYAAISAHDVVELLSGSGIKIAKNQVLFSETIKAKGVYPVTIKLSNTLKPVLTLKVVSV